MIEINVRHFRGCERAEIKCAPIALVAGKNAAGKSSLAQAAGAALAGVALPLPGITKGSANLLVRVGTDNASIAIRSDGGRVRVQWPDCAITTEGEAPPQASRWAAGLDSVAFISAKERAQILAQYLHADPSREDLAAALADVELGDEQVVEAVWQLIEDQGWDAAHTRRREKGAELKGRWRQVAGQNYGARVAASWRPKNWEDDLEELNEDQLAGALASAKRQHEAAIAAAAVSAAEREKQAALAADIEPRREALYLAEQAAEAAARELDAAQEARGKLPSGQADPGMPCPHCGAFVVVQRINLAETRLVPAETVPQDELKKRRLSIADADGLIGRRQGELSEANRAVERTRNALQDTAQAKNYLDAFPAVPKSGGDVAAAKASVETAEAQLSAWRHYAEASDLHQKIAGNERLIGILAPDGLRATKLAAVLALFNRSQLGPLAAAAEWQPVMVDAAMEFAYGGRPYALLSTSEQYRVRAMLQVAMARIDSSAMVVLDAADVLDAGERSGLFAMLEEAGLEALVCMTLSRREQVPDLAAAGVGRSYWLEDGVCAQFPEEAAA